jgi:CheY-like chemotaxis protein
MCLLSIVWLETLSQLGRVFSHGIWHMKITDVKTKTIVVVDDDNDDTDLIQTAVGEIDPQVECKIFNSAENAIAYFKDSSHDLPDFVILDLNMPKMSGRECLLQIRQIEGYSTVPVIINSTTIFPKDKSELKALGASFIFTKTNRFEKLVEILQYIMQKDWVSMH